jgi:hypothetical protein
VELVMMECTARVLMPRVTSGLALMPSAMAFFDSRSGGIGPMMP